jgi:medium-chain acyl-[acyl-carrier-protein] hydrolase
MKIIVPPFGYKEVFRIRTFEVDSTTSATLPAIIQLMQEAAMQNVLDIKLSVWDLEPHKISWVLMRKNMTINRLPVLGEKIEIVTYPAGFEKFFTYRDYKIFAENGDLLCQSSSTWLLMDIEKRRITRIPDFIKKLVEEMKQNAEIGLPRPNLKLDFKFEKENYTKEFEVNYFDLDFNYHLSNVTYLKWMLEAIPSDFLLNNQIKSLDILYRAECRLGEIVTSAVEQVEKNIFIHRLSSSEGKELMLAKTQW